MTGIDSIDDPGQLGSLDAPGDSGHADGSDDPQGAADPGGLGIHSPEQLDFPSNWDRIVEPAAGDGPVRRPRIEPSPSIGGAYEPPGVVPPVLNLVAASWADLVSLLGFCTACLLAIVVAGYGVALAALPWIIGAAVSWWCAAAAILVAVRRGTPGMLMAGVVFTTGVPWRRLPSTLAVAILQSCLLGLPAVVGAQRAPLALVSGVSLGAAANAAANTAP